MARSLEHFMDAINNGTAFYRPVNTVKLLGAHEITTDKHNFFEQAKHTYGAQGKAYDDAENRNSDDLQFWLPHLTDAQVRDSVMNSIHHTSLDKVPAIDELRKNFDPAQHIVVTTKDNPEHESEVWGSNPRDELAGMSTDQGLLAFRRRINNKHGVAGVGPTTVTHEVAHLITRLGRQFVPTALGDHAREFAPIGHTAHGAAFNAVHLHILRNVLGAHKVADAIEKNLHRSLHQALTPLQYTPGQVDASELFR